MDNWHILLGISLSWLIPRTIMQLTDGMYILNQVSRLLYWASFALSYELTGLHWGFCLIIAHIPGAIFWAFYEQWFTDEPGKSGIINDGFALRFPVENKNHQSFVIHHNKNSGT